MINNSKNLEEYRIYTWDEIAEAVNNLYKKHCKLFNEEEICEDYVRDFRNSALVTAMNDVLVQEFIIGSNNQFNDSYIVVNAWKQLRAVGYVGIKSKD